MMYTTIAIDGACRRNGQPDCVSAGACFILEQDETIEQARAMATPEFNSTSQRGELYGLLQAVEYVHCSKVPTVIVTDSEYLFNTITKEWVDRWMHNGWHTAQGQPVKNKDLWQAIWRIYIDVKELATVFHIKGHLMSVGAKKSREIMYQDITGYALMQWALHNRYIKKDLNKYEHAVALSEANNGFMPDEKQFAQFAAMNLVADAVANICVETAEAKQWQEILHNSVQTDTTAL